MSLILFQNKDLTCFVAATKMKYRLIYIQIKKRTIVEHCAP